MSAVRARRGAGETAEGFLQVGSKARFDGRLGGHGLVLLHGVLAGELELHGDLIVASDGILEDARGRVERLRVEGSAAGRLHVSEGVEVAAGGRLEGEIEALQLQSSPGATIEARLRIAPGPPPGS